MGTSDLLDPDGDPWGFSNGLQGQDEEVELTREQKLNAEIERQRSIRRPGADINVLRRAAISELMERGEW